MKGVQTRLTMQPNKELQRTLAKDGYITVSKAAALLPGVRPASVYDWVKAKDVAHRRVGGRLFVLEVDARRMLGLDANPAKAVR
jgi:hypothetical protein